MVSEHRPRFIRVASSASPLGRGHAPSAPAPWTRAAGARPSRAPGLPRTATRSLGRLRMSPVSPLRRAGPAASRRGRRQRILTGPRQTGSGGRVCSTPPPWQGIQLPWPGGTRLPGRADSGVGGPRPTWSCLRSWISCRKQGGQAGRAIGRAWAWARPSSGHGCTRAP